MQLGRAGSDLLVDSCHSFYFRSQFKGFEDVIFQLAILHSVFTSCFQYPFFNAGHFTATGGDTPITASSAVPNPEQM
jgi:hypothetical protein